MFGWDDFGNDGKRGGENKWEWCLVRRRGEEKNGGAQLFSLQAHQNLISQIGEKMQEKRGKRCIVDEIVLPPANRQLLFFFFFLFLSVSLLAFFFLGAHLTFCPFLLFVFIHFFHFQVIEVKYGCEWGGWCSSSSSSPHGVSLWKNIRKGWHSLSRYIMYDIGDGSKVLFWLDCWCGSSSLVARYPELYRLSCSKEASVADLMRFSNGVLHWEI